MDIDTLYNMAKAAARGAERALESTSGPNDTFFSRFGGYPAYIKEYNRLVPLVIQACGDEAAKLFPPIDIGEQINPADAIGAMWKTYLELASVRLNSLTAYLQSKAGSTDREAQALIDLVGINLRPAIYSAPQREVEIQNALETIFRARNLDYKREKVTIEYSSKVFIPDFTFSSLDLALDVKFAKISEKVKEIIDEINGDIPAY